MSADQNALLATAGFVTGSLGLLVSLFTYLRDTPRVKVTMGLDWSVANNQLRDPNPGEDQDLHCIITIANVGRRSIYLSHAHIPKVVHGGKSLVWDGTLVGIVLPEGGAPFVTKIKQVGLDDLAGRWWHARAAVVDATGRTYRSQWLTERPSFATDDPAPLQPFVALVANRWNDFWLRLFA